MEAKARNHILIILTNFSFTASPGHSPSGEPHRDLIGRRESQYQLVQKEEEKEVPKIKEDATEQQDKTKAPEKDGTKEKEVVNIDHKLSDLDRAIMRLSLYAGKKSAVQETSRIFAVLCEIT